MPKASNTRLRIMEIAEDAILAKGFDATSIEEIVAAAEISKGGFFYHFKDKNELALALIERYIELDAALYDGILSRAEQLSDDPLQVMLITLQFLAETLDDIPNGHPGCIAATLAYQERLFDQRVRAANREGLLVWRTRMRDLLERILELYRPREQVDIEALSDMVIASVEGGIVLAKGYGDPSITGRQVRLVRSYLKLLFSPRLQ